MAREHVRHETNYPREHVGHEAREARENLSLEGTWDTKEHKARGI